MTGFKHFFQENRRLEMELLDGTEKLVEAQSQNTKLQTMLDNIMKERVRRNPLHDFNTDFLCYSHTYLLSLLFVFILFFPLAFLFVVYLTCKLLFIYLTFFNFL